MTFNELNKEIQSVLVEEKFNTPTAIQEKAIPIILQKKDLIGIAQTGTGKTASFVLPILHLLSNNSKTIKSSSPLVLVLAPTRELAMQIDDSFDRFGKLLKIKHEVIFGGVAREPQIEALSNGVQVLTATPGRLIDLISQEEVNLSKVEYIVLDEAHMMLDMGFLPSVKEIFEKLSPKKQSLLFSATMTPEILNLSKELLNNPSIIEIEPEREFNLMSQKVFFLYVEKKNALLLELLKNKTKKKSIVFLRTKYKTEAVANLLLKHKVSARAIHSDKTQEERIKAIEDFKSGKINVLVATDIAARGLHVDNVSFVINYDTPNSPEVYVHRIGRTARAGKSGKSYTFCSLEEIELFHKIEEHTGQKMGVAKHTYYAEKVQNFDPAAVANTVKNKNVHKKLSKRSTKYSEAYVPPINQKKAKKPRGLSFTKNDRGR